jgi:hypothetical protein
MFSFLHLQNPLGHAFGDAYALPAPLVGPVDTTDYMVREFHSCCCCCCFCLLTRA